MVFLTHLAVEFRGSIGTYIPQIVDLLKDDDQYVRHRAAWTLSALSEQGM